MKLQIGSTLLEIEFAKRIIDKDTGISHQCFRLVDKKLEDKIVETLREENYD